MKLNITQKIENKLFNRTEIKLKIDHFGEPTPSRKELKEQLSASMNIDSELIVIKQLKSIFGAGESKGLVYIYKSKDILKRIEPAYLLKRGLKKRKESAPTGSKEVQSDSKEITSATDTPSNANTVEKSKNLEQESSEDEVEDNG